MSLEIASWHELLPVFKENFKIWSPGLSQGDYRRYIARQFKAPWLRQNLTYMNYSVGGQLRASLKVYRLELQSKGRTFQFAGLGAVFTQERYRNQGIGKKMMEAIVEQCWQQKLDGILLFSDIGFDYYRSLGFNQMGDSDFVIVIPDQSAGLAGACNAPLRSVESFHPADSLTLALTAYDSKNIGTTCQFEDILVTSQLNHLTSSYKLDAGLSAATLDEMTRHYMRWLRRQPFGFERTENYFAYKLGRERFIANHSRIKRPEMKLTIANSGTQEFGYALTEYSGTTMRILEVIGSENTRQELWKYLYKNAVLSQIKRICGFESVVRDFAPGFTMRSIESTYAETTDLTAVNGRIQSSERTWGKPMILGLNEAVLSWPNVFPCPILELDHL